MDQDTLQLAPSTYAAPHYAAPHHDPSTLVDDTGSDSVMTSIAEGAESLFDDITDALPDVPEALLLGEHGGVILLSGLIIATFVLLALSATTGAL